MQDWRKAITNLMQKTSTGDLNWSFSQIFIADAGDIVERSFEAKLKEKVYVVSKVRTKYYIDEDEFVWNFYFDLSIFDDSFEPRRIASAPPELSILSNLFRVVEDSFAFKNDALGDLL
ncbi:MAG: hypothetical protein ACU0FH_12265 [Heliomarina sp.]|uniref:hypothetical protein n=1 Tax=Heliomarina sp. TaxID=2917556 RepID=UPI0040598217